MPRDHEQHQDNKRDESKPASSDEARRVIQDYAKALREIIENLRRRFH